MKIVITVAIVVVFVCWLAVQIVREARAVLRGD